MEPNERQKQKAREIVDSLVDAVAKALVTERNITPTNVDERKNINLARAMTCLADPPVPRVVRVDIIAEALALRWLEGYEEGYDRGRQSVAAQEAFDDAAG